jgi:hypothetical protein
MRNSLDTQQNFVEIISGKRMRGKVEWAKLRQQTWRTRKVWQGRGNCYSMPGVVPILEEAQPAGG